MALPVNGGPGPTAALPVPEEQPPPQNEYSYCYGIYVDEGCCSERTCEKNLGTRQRRLHQAVAGGALYGKIIKWDRSIFSIPAVNKFHEDHPILCIPLSVVRFTLRTATAPLISVISAIVFPIMSCISDNPNKYRGGAGWAIWNTVVFAAIISLCVFGMSTNKMIIFVSIYGGIGVIGEILHGTAVRQWGIHDNERDYFCQETINNSRSGLVGLAFRYFYA